MSGQRYFSFSFARALWILRSVNRQWWRITSSTPLLWNNITIFHKSQVLKQDFVSLFISNSAGALLNIVVNLPRYAATEQIIYPGLLIFREVLDKIKSINMHLLDHYAYEIFLHAMGHERSGLSLEEVKLFTTESTSRGGNLYEHLRTSFIPTLNLQRLTMPPYPIPHITSFQRTIKSLSCISEADIFPIFCSLAFFESAQNLEHFRYYSPGVRSFCNVSQFRSSFFVNMPSLRSVDITTPGAGTDYLRNMNAPRLTHIRMNGKKDDPPGDHGYLAMKEQVSATLDMVSLRSPDLRCLQLEYTSLSHPEEEYLKILTGRWFPNLEELLLKVQCIGDQTFIAAAALYSTPLKKLSIIRCEPVTADGLRPFIVRRKVGFLLVLELCQGISEEPFQALSEFCQLDLVSRLD